ncbi:unnamed protein product, partial [Ectocarpus sp. 12 AP-2014]
MTDLDLFPRGKSAAAVDATASSSTPKSSSVKQDARKRKSSGAASPQDSSKKGKGGKDKDWLFGGGGSGGDQQQSRPSAPGKRPRGESSASSPGGIGASKGKKRGSASSEVGSGMLVEHSGRAPRLEMVSFKKLNKGTLAMGVVFKINEHDMVVSLPSSLTGVVRRQEVSDYFHQKAASAKNTGSNRAGGRGRYFDESHAGEKPLTHLFREGQVVRCAIISLAKEAKGRHIELSLRASVVNKGLSLSQLTKGSGVYGSVASVEDHGYVVTLGLDGVTAFLPKKDGPEEGLEPGQPVEAVIQTVKAAARTVTLTTDPSQVSSAVTQGTSFDLRSLKPGMLVDTIVDSVLSNGILVSFLGYFVGCVDHNNMPLVSGDGKDEPKGWRPLFRPGPEPVRARVLLVDYVNKAIRLTLRPHLMKMRAPSGLPPTGALLEGEVVRVDPALGLLLTVPSTEEEDGSEVAGNAPAAKKERGQGRRERRATAAAAAAAAAAGGDKDDGDDEEKKWKTIGAYVHISRISDERVEHVEKSYKPGQKVRCRVTGSSLVEGWAAASLRPSVLSAAVLRYQDLKPGSLVEGEVAAVEGFGLLVKLGEGVRALVPKNHLGDVTVKNPKARFKVGARVKGRVLTVDPGSSKSTLTLKRSMVKDKREVISTYTEAKEREGTACTGFVTKVAPFGLHVSFYGNVFGLLPSKALTKHGIQDPSEAFVVGQVVGCVVRSCDVTTYPPKLSLSLDVAGKTEEMGGTGAAEEDESEGEGGAASCPFSPGDTVSGVVAANQNTEGKVVVDLNLPPDTTTEETSSKKMKNKKSRAKQMAVAATVPGVLPHPHLGDHASVCGVTLAAQLTPGTVIDELLVLEIDKMGVPMVTLKPLLLSSVARSGEDKEAFVPGAASDVSPGDLIAGYVCRVESFGVFVRFLGRFTALCPRSMAADRMVEDPRGMFEEGDSARCVVQRVDEDTGRVVVTLDRTTVPTSPALYLRSLLSETFASAAAAGAGAGAASTATGNASGDEGADAAAEVARPWGRLEFGSTTNAVVVALKEYGVVLKAKASSGKRYKDKGGELMVCPLEHSMDGVEEGNEVKVRVIGMDLEKGIVEVTMDTDLVKAGRSKRLRAMVPLEPGETVPAKVLVAKPSAKWAVAVSEDGQGRLFVLQVADFHCPHRTCQDAGLCPDTPTADPADLSSCEAKRKTFVARVGESFSPGLEGYWETREDVGANGCNPYAGAVLVVEEATGNTGNRKSRRKRRGEHLDLGGSANDGDGVSDGIQDAGALMKAGRVSLGKIKTGAKVVCMVRSVHWDRLDVKVAVRYPKSYGPSADKARNRQASVENEEKHVQIEGNGKVDAEPSSKGSKKRRRAETNKSKAEESKAEPESDAKPDKGHRKQMVRIRAKIHCTAAGPPGLDGPAEEQGNDTAGEGVANLPQWHPLEKFHVGQVLTARVLHSEDMAQKDSKSDFVFRLLELGLLDGGGAVSMDQLGQGEAEEGVSVPAVPWWGECPPKAGEVHRGVITEVAEHGLLVSLSNSVRGLVPLANLSSARSDASVTAKKLGELFKRGMGLRVLVRRVEEQRRRLILSLVGVPDRDTLPDSALPVLSPGFQADVKAKGAENVTPKSPDAGDVVEGRVDLTVKAWSPPCVMVRLDGGGIGRVCVTELSEQEAWNDNPVGRIKDGARVKCRVLPPLPTRCTEARSKSRKRRSGDDDEEEEDGDGDLYMGPVELSLRPSRVEASKKKREEAIKREAAPKVGSTAKCYVVATGKSGCFVILDGGVSGRVLLKHLSDRFVSDPAQEFPAGKLVAGKVIAKDKETGRVSLSLKPSDVVGDEGGALTWSSEILKPGLKVKGTVDTVKDFGVFIQIHGSKVRGMCHRAEAADETIDDLTHVYDEGDLVKAVVLKVNKGKKRVSLGLKASYFEDDPDSDSDEDGSGSDEDGNEAESSDENDDILAAAAMQVPDDGGDEPEDESEEEESEDSDDDESQRASKRARGGVLGGGLGGEKVGEANAFSLNFGDLGISMGGAGASSDEDEDSDEDDDSDQDGGGASGKSHRSRKKAKERREEEDRVAARERALQDEDAAPETAGDYERLLVATPNDSLLWVKFMAFKLSLADVEDARAVCERGLKAVSFRKEQERFNLWVSLINLEHKYGSRATLKTVSERACQNSNPKKVYLHMAEMHEKAQESEECEEVFQAAVKKFRHSQKVWVAYQLSRLKRGDDAGAREALKRSLQSLARHKHVSVISRFAQNEFEHGSVERGRSVFEGLMASYPKRLDLWNVYVDKEVKGGDLRAARNLLERL